MESKQTHNAPEYMVGRGATIDLFILLIRACISCSVKQDRNIKYLSKSGPNKQELNANGKETIIITHRNNKGKGTIPYT